MPRISEMNRPLTACVVLLCCGALAGCDGESDATLKIEKAGRELSNVSPSLSSEDRSRAYGAIADDLRELSDVGTAKDAASVMTAQATAGRAQVALESGHSLSTDALDKVSELRVLLERYIRINALAEGASRQDFTGMFEVVDREASRLSDELDAARSRLAGIEREIEDLRAQREQLESAARGIREDIIEMKQSVESATATERQPVLEETLEMGRRADRREAQAGELSIRIEDAGLRERSIRQEIALIERQRELNAEARRDIEDMQNQLRQERNDLRSAAREQAQALRQGYTEALGTYRSESGASAKFDEAISGLSRAAGQATSGARSVQGGRASAANMRVMEATALIAKANVETALAELGADLSEVLPDAAGLLQEVEALRTSAEDAMRRAADAFDNASAVLENASERAQEIRAQLGDDAGEDNAGGDR